MIVRPVTLADGEGMPTMLAPTMAKGWNGFHVPVVTFPTFLAYWEATAQADPNGEWSSITPRLVAGVVRLPAMDAPDDASEDWAWASIGTDATGADLYALDGLTWNDPAPVAHHHAYRADISDWWCTTCNTVTDFCTDES